MTLILSPPPTVSGSDAAWRKWFSQNFQGIQQLASDLKNLSLIQQYDSAFPDKYQITTLNIAPAKTTTVSFLRLVDYLYPDLADNDILIGCGPNSAIISVGNKDLVITTGEDIYRRVLIPESDLWLGRYLSLGIQNPSSSDGIRLSFDDLTYGLRVYLCDPSVAHVLAQGLTSYGQINIGSDLTTVGAVVARLDFRGQDDADNNTTYARVQVTQDDTTDGSEDGTMVLRTLTAGSMATQVQLSDGVQIGAPTGGATGKGTVNIQGNNKLYMMFAGDVGIYVTSSNPEGNLTANDGSIAFRSNSTSAGNALWFKDSGTGNTGWRSMVPIGTLSNQSWNSTIDGDISRALDTDYQNSTNMAIQVVVSLTASSATILCGASTGSYKTVALHAQTATDTSSYSFIVPPTWYYKIVDGGATAIANWAELR